MISNVEKASLQLNVSDANTNKKSRTYNILNENGSYGFENDEYTADMIKVDALAKAIAAAMFGTYIDSTVIGVQRVGGRI